MNILEKAMNMKRGTIITNDISLNELREYCSKYAISTTVDDVFKIGYGVRVPIHEYKRRFTTYIMTACQVVFEDVIYGNDVTPSYVPIAWQVS